MPSFRLQYFHTSPWQLSYVTHNVAIIFERGVKTILSLLGQHCYLLIPENIFFSNIKTLSWPFPPGSHKLYLLKRSMESLLSTLVEINIKILKETINPTSPLKRNIKSWLVSQYVNFCDSNKKFELLSSTVIPYKLHEIQPLTSWLSQVPVAKKFYTTEQEHGFYCLSNN